MGPDADILTLTQWLSPAYPVGAFAYSHGLEWEVEAGQVTDADSLARWLGAVLQHGAGRTDVLFLAAAHRAETPADLSRIDDTCRAFAPSRERLAETVQQGAAFCEVTADVWGQNLPALAYPVAVGRAARLAGLALELTATLALQAFMANLVAAGMRLIPLGQTEGQRLIRDLTPLCAKVAESACALDLSHLAGTTFLADIASMKHETQYSRIFRT